MKNRWVPNETELKILKSYYEKNSNPKKDEKLAIVLDLEAKAKSQVTLPTITKWFEVNPIICNLFLNFLV